MLALSFLVVIGVVLIAEGFGHHVPKGYVYFAMAFSLGVEMLNIRMRKRAAEPVHLHAAVCARKGDQHSALTCSDSVRRVPLLVLIQHSSTHRGIRARA